MVRKRKGRSGYPFANATLKHLVERHTVSKETRIAQEALEQLNRVLDEISGWIILESERLARDGGKKTIDIADIRDATKLYLGVGGGGERAD
ncbi:MAG: hypothetical protein COT21_03335 [Hadesarchaea archaeon CG08_land_8_20_14_0_20_51_8]|nr:MAG: hypothetical protein COT21_03335 [Hadesarchaea archaeon CG08_land_8_20_14_0_20_51_8]